MLAIRALFSFVMILSFLSLNAQEDGAIFTIVEEMPTWKGCARAESEQKKQNCTMQKIQDYLVKNLSYPQKAKNEDITGSIYIKFIINKKGKVVDVEPLKNSNSLLDAEAVRVVENMPNWNPGKQRGMEVKVMFYLPIKFQLEK